MTDLDTAAELERIYFAVRSLQTVVISAAIALIMIILVAAFMVAAAIDKVHP